MANHLFEAVDTNDKSTRFVAKSIDIGNEIIDALQQQGMTQADLAARLKCSPALVSRWLSGVQNFTLRTLVSIEEILERDLIMTPTRAMEFYKVRPRPIAVNTKVTPNLNDEFRSFRHERLNHGIGYAKIGLKMIDAIAHISELVVLDPNEAHAGTTRIMLDDAVTTKVVGGRGKLQYKGAEPTAKMKEAGAHYVKGEARTTAVRLADARIINAAKAKAK